MNKTSDEPIITKLVTVSYISITNRKKSKINVSSFIQSLHFFEKIVKPVSVSPKHLNITHFPMDTNDSKNYQKHENLIGA